MNTDGDNTVTMSCEHIIMKRHGTSNQCRNAANFFYHNDNGNAIHICGIHANSYPHRWNKPMRIIGSDEDKQ